MLQRNSDNVSKASMALNSIQTQIEQKISSFIRNFKPPGPVFEPIPICQLSIDNYMALFPDNEGKYGAKLYYENGTLYLLDTLSYLHGQLLSFITYSLILNNLFLEEYFNCSSYSKNEFIYFLALCSGDTALEPDLALSIRPEKYSGPLLHVI